MEIISVIYHLFIMGTIAFIVTGVLGFLFPNRFNFLSLIVLSILLGFGYSYFAAEFHPMFTMVYSTIVALSAIGVVKVCYYAKEKAEQMREKMEYI